MKNENKNQRKIIVIAALLVLVLAVAGTYAWLRINVGSGTKTNIIKAGTLQLRIGNEAENGINLINEIPKSYREGMLNQEYTFDLINDGSIDSDYTITLNDLAKYIDNESNETVLDAGNKLSDDQIRIMITKNGETAAPENSRLLSEDPGRVIDTGTINGGQTISYSIHVWIDSAAGDDESTTATSSVMGKYFSAQLTVNAVQSHQ